MHDPDHHHEHVQPVSKEERLALLKYMAHHNAHHAEELHELAHELDGTPAGLLHEAVRLMENSTEKINEALKLLEE